MKSKELVFAISKKVRNHSLGVSYFGLALLSQPDTAEIILLGHSKLEGTHSKKDSFQDTQQGRYRRWNSRKGTWKLPFGLNFDQQNPKFSSSVAHFPI